MFSKLPYAMIKNGKKVKVNIYHRLLREIKLCISVNIYHRLPKLGMSTHVFKITLCYDKKWEIKLCISVNIYHKTSETWYEYSCFQNYLML